MGIKLIRGCSVVEVILLGRLVLILEVKAKLALVTGSEFGFEAETVLDDELKSRFEPLFVKL